MVESEKVVMLDIKLYDDDIVNFVNIVEKLLELSSKPGFIKQFTIPERDTIYLIAESINLDIPKPFHVQANIETVRE